MAESIPDETHYENLYKICANIIHPYDSDYADFLKGLFDIRFQKKNIQGCVEILRLILRNQYQNLPRYYSQIGITEMVAAKNCNIINLLDEGETHWVEFDSEGAFLSLYVPHRFHEIFPSLI